MRQPASLALLALLPAFAAAQTPASAPVRLDPYRVEGRLLTDSPATVSRVELADLPAAENTSATLAERTANFFVATNDAHSFNDTYALRGLTNTPIFGGPAISYYLDDLPLGQAFTFPTDLAGFTAAELHRGPTQNTVYGRAGSAGVLTLRTPEPAATAGGEITAGYGRFDAFNASVRAASAAGGVADAYASAAWSRRDGYITNTQLGRDIDDKDSLSALTRLRWRPAEGTELTFLATALRARDGVQPLVPLGGPLFTVSRAQEGDTNLDAFDAALTAARELAVGRLSATTAYSDWDLAPYSNTLAFAPGFELVSGVRQRQRTWTEEIKLAAPAASSLRWQAGIFGSSGRTDGAFDRFFGPFPYERSVYRTDAEDLAAYGEATAKLSDALQFTAGLRLESARREMLRRETVPAVQTFDLDHRASALLPKLGLSYTVAPGTAVFATAGAGFKPGGFSAFTGNRALAAFGPERTKTLEAGLTRADPSGRYTATLRGFWYDITGYQIERSFATSAVADDYLVVNAPRARSVGGEFEFAWRPVAGLTLAADLGVTRVTLREFTDPYTGVSYAGKRAPFVPSYDASLRADYRAAAGWFVGAELSRNGRTPYTEDNSAFFAQDAVSLLSARLGYDARRWRMTVYGRNLTDEDYYSAITPGTGHGTPGAPRTIGAEVAVKF